MSPRTRYTFFIDEDQRSAIAAVKERDGIPESEQIRRALKEWLERRGDDTKKPARKRTAIRKRA